MVLPQEHHAARVIDPDVNQELSVDESHPCIVITGPAVQEEEPSPLPLAGREHRHEEELHQLVRGVVR